MGRNTSVSLGDYFEDFVDESVSKGRFKNASEVIRAGLRLLEVEENRIIVLKNAINDGIESGVAQHFDANKHLELLKAKLSAEPKFESSATKVQCLDPNGMTIVFEKTMTTDVSKSKTEGINQFGNVQRVNAASPVYDKAEPVDIGHVVFFTPDLKTTQAFYIEKLGFHLSDAYTNRGAFLRCRGEGFHHDLFLLSIPNKPAGLNHVAFVVRDIHEVIGGGLSMNRQQWSTFIGPGRHPISSAYFWYVNSPLGGAFEYYTNDDYLTEEWKPREEEHRLELFTEWAIEGGLDHETRRQVKPV